MPLVGVRQSAGTRHSAHHLQRFQGPLVDSIIWLGRQLKPDVDGLQTGLLVVAEPERLQDQNRTKS